MSDIRYLLYDNGSRLVLTVEEDPIVASALASGSFYSTTIHIIPIQPTDQYFNNDRAVYQKIPHQVIKKQYQNTVAITDSSVPEAFTVDQRIIQNRQDIFRIWGMLNTEVLSRNRSSYWDNFETEVYTQLGLCSPGNKQFTPMIEEYAYILGVDPEIAYKELKLKSDGERMLKFRITALAEKWKLKINSLSMSTELEQVKLDMIDDFRKNSSL